MMPANCYVEPPISCSDFKVTSDGVDLVLANGVGADMQNVSISVTGCSSPSRLATGTQTWIDGTQISMIGDNKITGCGTLNTGDKFNSQIFVSYVSNGISHTKKGDIHTKVE